MALQHRERHWQAGTGNQKRVITLFAEELGYKYLGDWTDWDRNSNLEEGLLSLAGEAHP